MKFKVRAVAKDGYEYTDFVEASDRFAVYRDLRERGDRVIDVREELGRSASFSFSSLSDIFRRISLDEKVILTRNLAAMLDAGLTISRALSVMERQTQNPLLKTVLSSVIASVKQGEAFSAAIAKFPRIFSPLLVSMSRAGEESGKLAASLRVASIQMDRSSNLRKKIRSALVYPAIVIIAMLGIGILMLVYVVPTLSGTFQELHVALPGSTLFIISASDFLTHHTLLSISILILVFAGALAALRTKRGKEIMGWIALKTPIIRALVVEVNAARTTRTLASLLSAGVDMILSISITRDVIENAHYKKVLAEAEQSVTKGLPLSTAFAKHSHLYPPLVTEIIAVGEESGHLSELLKDTAEFYEESVERQTKDLSTVIEPLLMLFVGALVGFFAISMIAPIYSLSNSI
jgi:type IV pilus assembly protein PilC